MPEPKVGTTETLPAHRKGDIVTDGLLGDCEVLAVRPVPMTEKWRKRVGWWDYVVRRTTDTWPHATYITSDVLLEAVDHE